ncbi:hypothetical protein SAMN02910447_01764 [Ruminococcus sp. YE71]|uniref:chemotaxis protein CheX n=1 Tax=unclassified Ruminococcus TaxID=2608920 RepID=UPI00088299A1|nr:MULTISPECIES: chemotaxis protein CheX [unclassified Ruminococcus]SDA21213.1 hypothetical protein SAMN02910446_01907 [Ruminococcus sp. YE78]SFW32898.1 hypothetical protein SAMN02910447_01764 [Ruminococcus sp. YE71]
MFSQFFGGFLLNNGLVTKEQLAKALDEKKNTRMRLGVLAINEGLMTSEQVEIVNVTQQTVDKRFGDLAVELGYIAAEDVEKLLSKQPTDYLLLGQTLVNMGVLSNADFETAINTYKQDLSIEDEDLNAESNDKMGMLVKEFFHFGTAANARLYTSYATLLFKSLIRFIGDDFTPLEAEIVKSVEAERTVRQDITGAYSGVTVIATGEYEYRTFAKRFAKDAYVADPEFDDASVAEFLNVCNGLYAVNESNESGTEISLTPLAFTKGDPCEIGRETFLIPVQFTFGEVAFAISF